MKKTTCGLQALVFILVTLLSNNFAHSQESNLERAQHYIQLKGELTFSFQIGNPSDIEQFSNALSILNYNPQTGELIVWANAEQFTNFLQQGIEFTVLESENQHTEGIVMSNQVSTANRGPYPLAFPLSAYPTYADYELQMQEFANNHSDICELVDIGGTTEGVAGGNKRLLFIKISDNIATEEAEPKLMYTSSIHGDEITGYPLMMNLIDYFITAYKDTGHSDHLRIKNLIDNSEIWINPMANPDGTYYNDPSNTSVVNARRANANGLDLNRNYPDNVAGPHANGHTAYELETQHFMTLAENTHFVLSANFHGGVEVVNYPWDNTYDRHADDDWFIHVSREYADNCQADGPAGYMDYLNNGITHGADWYRVYGGRQDYMNFYYQCKETTIELSDVKLIPSNQLVNHWNYNREALIEYLIQGTYGFQGIVKDAVTGDPIEATVTLVGHDNAGSHTVSTLPHGDYYRPVYAGTYDILFEADCYQPVTLSGQTITNYETKILSDILLTPIAGSAPSNLASSNVQATTATISWNAITGATYEYQYREVGSPTWTTVSTSNNSVNLSGLNQSTQYEVQVRSLCNTDTSPYSSSVLFTTTTPPPCSGTLINAYPYNESFESGFADWTQETSDNFNWTRNSGSTPSNSTGPSSGYSSTFYLYAEANGQSNNTTILNSPCYNLNNKADADFSFAYHMYGSQMGSLALQISTNDGSNWTTLWSLSGNQNDQWYTNTIDLSAYLNQYVRLRFVATIGSVTGQSTSDIAIDTISFTASDASITPVADCKDITVTLDETGNVTISASAIDNGNSEGNLSIDVSSFDCSNIGANNVTLTATDPNDLNNTDSCVAVVTVNQQATPTATNCWDDYQFNDTLCVWENIGSQPVEPTATNCWDNYQFNETLCVWENQGVQPAEPTATNCWDDYQFNSTLCVWENQGAQPAEPTATNCWDDYQFNDTLCVWENQGAQPAEPTATNCWDNYQFNETLCAWENLGSQPAEPTATNCWDDYQFNDTLCVWENIGSQPAKPTATNCWDDFQFNTTLCVWENQGVQPVEPTATNCWDDYQFNDTLCVWENQGAQPAEPTATNCWDNYQFNETLCTWENIGSQPVEPTATNCWDDYQFNETLCDWENIGSQPVEPTATNCWDDFQFNDTLCVWENQGAQPAEPTATNCWDDFQFNETLCTWENIGSQPVEPTATNCWDDFQFNTTLCVWENQGVQPVEPTATNCWDDYQFNDALCVWENIGSQPAEPTATNCWDDYQFNSTLCAWENLGSQPAEPTATNCWDDYQFNDALCAWENLGSQPAEPTATNCWDDFQFNETLCAWENLGSQPVEPTATNCWDDYQFNTTLCAWENQGAQPTEPTATNCWDDYQFNDALCAWENLGSQPAEPTATNCWDDFQFNDTLCAWENLGSQPAEPTATNCWDDFQFNETLCAWENLGSQPAEPTATNCWDDFQFNTTLCVWENLGSQPAEPTATNCWDDYQFNDTLCVWENLGSQPVEPTATNCWDDYQFNSTLCVWENQGTQPAEPTATNCWDDYQFNSTLCAWENLGAQPMEPTATNCWDNYQFNDTLCAWENIGSQPAEPTATNCWDDFQFNTTLCVWENIGSQPAEPTATNCWDDFQFNSTLCVWENQGAQPVEPTATNCWDDFQFNTTLCVWENQGAQPAEPETECWETASFNNNTCIWEVSNNGDIIDPVCITKDITIELDVFGDASITVNDIDNGSFDNCGINSMGLSQYNFTTDNVGINMVTLTIMDQSGNVSNCDAMVTVTENSLGIPTVDEMDSIKLYPNPFNTTLMLELRNDTEYSIQLFDVNGRKVYEQTAQPTNNILEIKNLNIEQGHYFIKIINKTTKINMIKKLIKY